MSYRRFKQKHSARSVSISHVGNGSPVSRQRIDPSNSDSEFVASISGFVNMSCGFLFWRYAAPKVLGAPNWVSAAQRQGREADLGSRVSRLEMSVVALRILAVLCAVLALTGCIGRRPQAVEAFEDPVGKSDAGSGSSSEARRRSLASCCRRSPVAAILMKATAAPAGGSTR
jgi:hypothetical protein